MSVSKFPRRMMSDPINSEDRKKFIKKCKDLNVSPAMALRVFIEMFPLIKFDGDIQAPELHHKNEMEE